MASIKATPKNLVPAKAVAAGPVAQFMAETPTLLGTVTLTNTSLAPITCSVYLQPSGQPAGASNQIVRLRSIAANECYRCPELAGQVLEAGDSLTTEAGAVGLTIRASGVVYVIGT